MKPSVIVRDLETVPDLPGLAAATSGRAKTLIQSLVGATETFLALNGVKLGVSDKEIVQILNRLAVGQLPEDKLAEWFGRARGAWLSAHFDR